MELGLREWLIIGGAIVVLLIVLDGWRRMRGGGNRLKMKIDKSFSDIPDLPEESSYNPELPGGGARVVGRQDNPHSGSSNADSRREPVFGNDELDLSPPRTSSAAHHPIAQKPISQKPVLQKAASQAPVFETPVTSTAAVKQSWAKKSEVKKPVHITPTFAEDEHDPLFAASDSFPPHHDGPSFDEMDEGVSAPRVVRVPEPEPRVEISTEVDAEESPLDDNAVEEMIPVVNIIVQPEPEPEPEPELELESEPEPETEFQSEAVPENEELFPVEYDEIELEAELEPETIQRVSAYSAEDDDLIDSLPEGFRVDRAAETDDEDDEHEFDYTRPVSELMRPVREDNNRLQQTAMDLPERQESIFSLVDEPVTKSQPPFKKSRFERVKAALKPEHNAELNSELSATPKSEHKAERKSDHKSERKEKHFSALDDEENDLADGFFIDSPLIGAEEKPAAKTAKADSGIGIKGQSLQKIPEADKVLVISVAAADDGLGFSGRSLLQILLACGMRYGDMKIFHRYEDGIDKGAIQFSMTNALEPGYFDIDTMDSMETRGVTFFMSMEEPRDVMNAYECMLATAVAVAKNLHGVLLDENRSTMRDQTKEHYRERIRKFEMRKLKKSTTA
ncbi:cell division protein ZipA [uncultured Amphritea sp.]|uniref:cell division protein ZipA n=1 Tax=uncultured Amphritea sp. TaxID=981605 RepID=UPI00261DD48E|nr:cell division protein ZipA [uncultured Amphritea sp.]